MGAVSILTKSDRVKGNSNVVLGARVQRLEDEMDAVKSALEHGAVTYQRLEEKLDRILAYIEPAEVVGRAAAPVWRLLTKHKGTVVPFALGLAVAGGWINPEIAAHVRVLFGLAAAP